VPVTDLPRPVGAPAPHRVDKWQDAELNAAAWLRYFGYPDAQITAAGPDEGIDVVARHAVAQVKARASKVSRPEVQQLVGAATGTDAATFFFSLAGYTEDALAWAGRAGVAAFRFALDGDVVPQTQAAKGVLADATKRHSPSRPPQKSVSPEWAAWVRLNASGPRSEVERRSASSLIAPGPRDSEKVTSTSDSGSKPKADSKPGASVSRRKAARRKAQAQRRKP
jgi:hypothetical protein